MAIIFPSLRFSRHDSIPQVTIRQLTICLVACLILISLPSITHTAFAQEPALILIPTIQGNGTTSPLYQSWIDTFGLVTGVVSDGFYLQDPTGDGDPATSDGIFVYTRQPPTVQVGQCVELQRAYVDEFYEKTELSRIKAILPSVRCLSSATIPAVIPAPKLGVDPTILFEQYEGMVVQVADLQGIVQGPTKHFADGERELALIDAAHIPYLPGGRVFQHNTAAMQASIYMTNALGATLPEARWGDHVFFGEPTTDGLLGEDSTVQAILDYNFGKYQLLLWPDTSHTIKRSDVADDEALFAAASEASVPASADGFTICTYNLHGMGRGSEQFWNPLDYDRQLAKHGRAIAELLHGCTILGLQEAGTPADVAQLAELLASAFDLDYMSIALPGPGTQSNEFPLTNGLIALSDRVQILASALRQGCSYQDYEVLMTAGDCPAGQYALFNRPPLVVDLAVQGMWEESFPLTVIVNHWKSKGGDESVNVVRRTAQAAYVATLVQEKLDVNPNAHMIVLGDLNDYYVSGPIETLRTSVQPPLLHLYDYLRSLDRYTYIFNGGSQVLDHLLVTPGLEPLIARVDPIHLNADYPSGDNQVVSLLQRSSDHDPVILHIRPDGAGIVGGNLHFPGIHLSLTPADNTTEIETQSQRKPVAEATTDANGDFRFWALSPGDYDLHIDTLEHFPQSAQTGILTITTGFQTLETMPPSEQTTASMLAMIHLTPALLQEMQ